MYEELITNLRNCAETNSLSLYKRELMKQAADAIEELQGFLYEAERDRDEYRDRMEKTFELMPRWIPVADRLPEDGQDILAIQSYTDEVRIVPANYDRGVWYDCFFNRVATHITHWRLLPEPPKEETE